MPMIASASGTYREANVTPEKLLTFVEAAEAVGAKYWQIQRAVKRGLIPSYAPFNSRRLVKLFEVLAYIDSCREGGSFDEAAS